jgi:PKHD-type hydroxylase
VLLAFSELLTPNDVSTVISSLVSRAPEQSAPLIHAAIRAHPLIALGVYPRILGPPIFHSTAAGEVMRKQAQSLEDLRCDVWVVVFLSDPADYSGGELWIDTGYGEEPHKGRLGGCVAYSCSAKARFAEVASGHRLVAEVAVQSRVPDPAQRQILYDLGCVLHYFDLADAEGQLKNEGQALQRCWDDLLRMWGEG